MLQKYGVGDTYKTQRLTTTLQRYINSDHNEMYRVTIVVSYCIWMTLFLKFPNVAYLLCDEAKSVAGKIRLLLHV